RERYAHDAVSEQPARHRVERQSRSDLAGQAVSQCQEAPPDVGERLFEHALPGREVIHAPERMARDEGVPMAFLLGRQPMDRAVGILLLDHVGPYFSRKAEAKVSRKSRTT